MFSHVMIGANNIEESKKFYDAILGELGYKPGMIDPNGRCFYFSENGVFALSVPIDGAPASHGNGSTIGFNIADTAQGDAWHAAGLANGGTNCEDAPGVRDGGAQGSMYLAYLRDPAGNKICALLRMG